MIYSFLNHSFPHMENQFPLLTNSAKIDINKLVISQRDMDFYDVINVLPYHQTYLMTYSWIRPTAVKVHGFKQYDHRVEIQNTKTKIVQKTGSGGRCMEGPLSHPHLLYLEMRLRPSPVTTKQAPQRWKSLSSVIMTQCK